MVAAQACRFARILRFVRYSDSGGCQPAPYSSAAATKRRLKGGGRQECLPHSKQAARLRACATSESTPEYNVVGGDPMLLEATPSVEKEINPSVSAASRFD